MGDRRMIRRLLVANRGEIAVRIIRACRELDIESVAVYSEADSQALHVQLADRAEPIGGAPPAESYLNVAAIIGAARRAGADAIHPGYGFLSEGTALARACTEGGLVFVGPPVDALERMGSKLGARRLMQQAGVPIVPGEAPADQSDEALTRAVRTAGFPALVKPSAGGGGIGMKIVRAEGDIGEALQRARRVAEAAFGDGTLYVERLIERPRHVEFQVLADAHGHVVQLFERECSIQRRHQKMIEESPCAALTPALRQKMGDAAVAAARAAGYVNAGTVEFLLEGRATPPRFYFLEMNTRLQVEHPVTELATGVDLVHAQLRIAGGEPLAWDQRTLSRRGHAIECRIYAEDPRNDFLPQAGRVLMYREPQGPGIRVDSGIAEGSTVPVFYDPLLAKLVVAAETREAAVTRLRAALERFIVLGIQTNIPYLLAILRHPRFVAADLDAWFLDAEHESLARATSATTPLEAIAAAAYSLSQAGPTATAAASRGRDPFDDLTGWGRW
jgi:acetyl-CoA carboxylase biotin carboxylase subunit